MDGNYYSSVSDLDLDLEACRAYPELEPELQALLSWVFEQPEPPSWEATLHEIGWDDELLHRALNLGLIAHDGKVRLAALALPHRSEDPASRALLDTLAALARVAHERYEPGCGPIERDALEQATGRTTQQLIDAEPFARDLHISIRVGVEEGGPIGDEPARYVSVQPDAASARAPRLEPLFRGLFPRDRVEARRVGPRSVPFRLRSIRAAGFRALEDLRLELRAPLTVLVGPNGAGKSTVLDAIAFLARALEEHLRDATRQEGGVGRLRTRGFAGPVELEAGFHIDPGLGDVAGRYRVVFDALDREAIVEEELLELDDPGSAVWLQGRRAAARIRRADGAFETQYGGVGNLTLSTLADDDRFPVPVHVRRGLADIVLVDRDPLLHAVQGAEGRSGRQRFLTPARALLEAVASSDTLTDRLSRTLRELVLRVDHVRRVVRAGEAPHLEVVERGVPGASRFDEVSAGMRQMLLVGALYVAESPPCTILLEEPDAGLHVGVLHVLRDLLRSLAQRSVVIATTHSLGFVGLLDPEREVVALGRGPDGVRAVPLSEALREKRWLDEVGSTAEAFLRAAAER